MKTKPLDRWDCRMIALFKSNKDVKDELLKIWGDRCALDPQYCHLKDINNHLFDLALELGLIRAGFVLSLDSEENFRYVCGRRSYLSLETKDFQLILLSRLNSLFSLTLVKDLPGYLAFIRA